jgi:protein TonB
MDSSILRTIIVLIMLMGLSCSDDKGVSPTSNNCDYCDFDTPPILLEYIPPEYPALARERGIEGTVLLRVHVNSEGSVFRTSIIQSDVDWTCEMAARKAAIQFEFTPAMKDGIPCCAKMAVPIRFKL